MEERGVYFKCIGRNPRTLYRLLITMVEVTVDNNYKKVLNEPRKADR